MASPGTWIECTERQIGPYLAFLPDDLPPTSGLDASVLWTLAEKASYALGQLQDMEERLPAPDLLAVYPAIREAHASAKVEGTTTSLAQALGFEDVSTDEQQRLDFSAILDHLEAQDLAKDMVLKHGFRLEHLLQAHAVLVRSDDRSLVEPGRWRSKQNYLPGEHPGIQHAIHVPPPASEVSLKMEALEQFILKANDLPKLVKAGLAHAQFELIHPFADGNGRMGRMLILLQLQHGGQLASSAMFLSDYFLLFRDRYFQYLTAVGKQGDWISWLQYFLIGVEEVAQAAREVGDAIIQLEGDLSRQLQERFRSEVAEELLAFLFRNPRITVASAAEGMKAGHAAVNNAVNRLVDLGWLKQVTPGRRNRVFVFEVYRQCLRKAGVLDRERISERLARHISGERK